AGPRRRRGSFTVFRTTPPVAAGRSPSQGASARAVGFETIFSKLKDLGANDQHEVRGKPSPRSRGEGTASGVERRPLPQLDRLARPAFERSHAGEGGGGRHITVPGARARRAALRGGGEPGAELGVEGRAEPRRPVIEHPAREEAAR